MPGSPFRKLVFVHSIAEIHPKSNQKVELPKREKSQVHEKVQNKTPASVKESPIEVAKPPPRKVPTPKTEIVFETSSDEVPEEELSVSQETESLGLSENLSEGSEDSGSVHESDFEVHEQTSRSGECDLSTEEDTFADGSSDEENSSSEEDSIGRTLSTIEEKALVGAFRAHKTTPEITVFGKFGEACNAITVPQNVNLEELSLRFADEFGFTGKAVIFEEIEDKEPGCLVVGYQYFRKLVYAEKINDGDFFQVRPAPTGKGSKTASR